MSATDHTTAWLQEEAARLGERLRAQSLPRERRGAARALLRRVWDWEQSEARDPDEAAALLRALDEAARAEVERDAAALAWRLGARRRRLWPLRLPCLREDHWALAAVDGALSLCAARERRVEALWALLKPPGAGAKAAAYHPPEVELPVVEKQGRS
jgi:hypothetical protein